jgi:hypothetical protein
MTEEEFSSFLDYYQSFTNLPKRVSLTKKEKMAIDLTIEQFSIDGLFNCLRKANWSESCRKLDLITILRKAGRILGGLEDNKHPSREEIRVRQSNFIAKRLAEGKDIWEGTIPKECKKIINCMSKAKDQQEMDFYKFLLRLQMTDGPKIKMIPEYKEMVERDAENEKELLGEARFHGNSSKHLSNSNDTMDV